MNDPQRWRELGQQLRVDSIRAAAAAKSGHPTSSMSAADLMAVLMTKYLHYDFGQPDNPNNDHLIFSKGHASPLLYSMYKAAGAISDDDLLSFRKQGSRFEGHPTPILPWVDVATGSLGQGLPIGVGVALAGKKLDRLPYRVWVLCGDSEMAEGSMWEAFEHAAFNELDNITAIIDVNRLGQTGETMHGWNLDYYSRRLEACGWKAIEADGHDVEAIDRAYAEAIAVTGRPTVIVARTVKGQGAAEVANKNGAHGKPVPHPEQDIEALGGERHLQVDVPKPASNGKPHTFAASGRVELPRYELGGSESVRKAFGDALAALGAGNGKVVALDGEVGNSTYTEIFEQAHPERFFQMYIAEQQMIAGAVGMQVRGWRPYAATFAAFMSRAYDFVRMAAISRATMCLVGTHAGVSIGEDGPSQMALEDIAAFRAVFGSTVLYPCDPNQTAQLVAQMAELDGISYLRATREKTPVIYSPDERFRIGGSKVLRQTDADAVTLIGGGVTLHEALKAADALAADGINARVIDLYSIKPIDADTLHAAAAATGRLITVEDHWPEGGLGEAVLSVFADSDRRPRIVRLAVEHMPGSATPEQQLADAGIDAPHIADAARAMVGEREQVGVK